MVPKMCEIDSPHPVEYRDIFFVAVGQTLTEKSKVKFQKPPKPVYFRVTG